MALFVRKINRIGFTAHSYIFKNETCFTHIQLVCHLTKKANTGEDEESGLTYVRNDKLYKISKKATMTLLQEILPIEDTTAAQMLASNKQLCEVPPIIIKDNYETCKIYGISNETLMSYPYLLAQKDFAEKVHILSELPGDINKMLQLLKMNIFKLHEFVKQFKKNTERVVYFSELLNVPTSEICEQIIKKPFLANMKMDRVTDIVHLLREHGITNREIVNDLWALNYSKETMEKRITFAKENNLEKVKTWMIRAPSNILLNYIRIRSDNKLILGNNSLAEYLSRRLECTVEFATLIITKQPALKTKSVKKMDEIIDYLYGVGFKPIQVRTMPKILLHSVETMKKRISELQHYGVHVDTLGLGLLTKTQKQYEVYYNLLVRNNKNKLKGIK